MMNVSEYANDVGKKVSEILKLCQTLDIKVSNELMRMIWYLIII